MVDVDRYGDIWKNEMAPTDESYDEADVSDKVAGFENLPKIPYGWEVYINNHYRDRLRATLSFDDQLGAIVDKLEQLGQLNNTYIFVTSDNGFSLGQNRMFGKGYHFDHASRVPLLVAGPGITPDSKHHLLAHIDLAPTIVDIAGGTIPALVDGISFKQLIDDPNSVPERNWRESILIENWETKSIFGTPILCAANTMRRYDSVYTEHATGDFEYYDLSEDPLQLEQLIFLAVARWPNGIDGATSVAQNRRQPSSRRELSGSRWSNFQRRSESKRNPRCSLWCGKRSTGNLRSSL